MLSLTAYFSVFLDPKADGSDLQNVLMFEKGIEFFCLHYVPSLLERKQK